MVGTSVKAVLKFAYDQINISSRVALLKNISNSNKFGGQKNIVELNVLVFVINGEISSRKLVVLL